MNLNAIHHIAVVICSDKDAAMEFLQEYEKETR